MCLFSDISKTDVPEEDYDYDGVLELMNTKVKKALGLNATWGGQREDVWNNLMEDFMVSYAYSGTSFKFHDNMNFDF